MLPYWNGFWLLWLFLRWQVFGRSVLATVYIGYYYRCRIMSSGGEHILPEEMTGRFVSAQLYDQQGKEKHLPPVIRSRKRWKLWEIVEDNVWRDVGDEPCWSRSPPVYQTSRRWRKSDIGTRRLSRENGNDGTQVDIEWSSWCRHWQTGLCTGSADSWDAKAGVRQIDAIDLLHWNPWVWICDLPW